MEFLQGVAESLPFPDNSFDFINMSEVLEHIDSPEKGLAEAFRVLRPGGSMYLSAPNRFGFRDPHYHIYGINWMSRAMSEQIIAALGRAKGEEEHRKGRNELSRMHYYRYSKLVRLASSVGR